MANNQWIDRTAATKPSIREATSLVYDTVEGDLILFGGMASGSPVDNATWEFNGTIWTDISSGITTPPTARGEHAAAFKESSSEMWIAGGNDGSTKRTVHSLNAARDDYDVEGILPGYRRLAGMIYGSGIGRLIFHGGLDEVAAIQGDTWYEHGAWTSYASGGPAVHSHAMVYDPVRDVIVLYGGTDSGGITGDTWEMSFDTSSSGTWTQRTPAHSPGDRNGAMMVYQKDMGMTLLFGGYNGSSYEQDIWGWDGNDWHELSDAGSPPPIRAFGAFASNYKTASGSPASLSGLTVLFGGDNSGGELQDTYELETSWLSTDLNEQTPQEEVQDGFDVDLIEQDGVEGDLASVDIDLVWFLSPPVFPPEGLDDPQPFQVVQTWRGRDEYAKYLGGLIEGGYITKFKIGEGGWRPSVDYNEQVGTGTGSVTVACTFSVLPIVPSSITVTAGGQTVTDDGAGGFTGDGSGTIDYKTGAATITFDSTVTGGTPVNAVYKWRGRLSRNLVQDIGTGNGSLQIFAGTIVAYPVYPGSVVVSDENTQTLIDDGAGNLTGDGTGTVNYDTGAISVTFTAPPPADYPIRVTFKYMGEAQAPDPGKTELESESTSGLYTFEKDFQGGDIVFQGTGSGKSRVTLSVGLSEANDDGTGEAPYFFEGGFFTENDVLVCYFTFPRFKKTSSVTFDRVLDLAI